MLQIVIAGKGISIVDAYIVSILVRVGLLVYLSQNNCNIKADPSIPNITTAIQKNLKRIALL